jgi:hypothetical protein
MQTGGVEPQSAHCGASHTHMHMHMDRYTARAVASKMLTIEGRTVGEERMQHMGVSEERVVWREGTRRRVERVRVV